MTRNGWEISKVPSWLKSYKHWRVTFHLINWGRSILSLKFITILFAIHNAYFSDISESQYILLAIIDFLFNQDGQLEKSNSKGKGPTPTNTKRQVLNYLLTDLGSLIGIFEDEYSKAWIFSIFHGTLILCEINFC